MFQGCNTENAKVIVIHILSILAASLSAHPETLLICFDP
jgi:hypothetical protein